MVFLLIVITFIIIYLYVCKLDNAKNYDEYKKWKRTEMRIRYRIHITCNDVIIARTFTGDNFSKVIDDAIDYSLKEAGDFPDVIVLVKDVIYL